MKSILLSLIVLSVTSLAQADGFHCKTIEGDVSLLIHNHAHPEAGTRKGAVMVVTDRMAEADSRNIIHFYGDAGRLMNKGSRYVGIVGENFRDGTYVDDPYFSGAFLSELLQIVADIDFSYGAPVANGAEVLGTMILIKQSGDEIVRDLSCKRFLKN